MDENDWKNFQKSEELHRFSEDPEDEPYKSKYEGRTILKDLLKKLESLLANNNADDAPHESSDELENLILKKSALCCVLYKLAINYVDCEERPEGEQTVMEILNILNQQHADRNFENNLNLHSKTVSVHVAAKNYLGYIYCDRADNENSLHNLCESETVYYEYKKKIGNFEHNTNNPKEDRFPWELTDALKMLSKSSVDDDVVEDNIARCWVSFEKLHTYTLFYLAKLYKNLNEFSKSASYCQKTLERQIAFKDYDPVEWALNAATLSQYYIGKSGGENFPQARHCLAAALAVIDLYESNLSIVNTDSDSSLALFSDSLTKTKEKIVHCKADVYRCYAKYGLALLECSQEKFLSRDLPLSNPNTNESAESQTTHQNIFIMENIAKYEREISTQTVRSFMEAREIFLKIQTWLNKAKEYYAFNDFATDFVEIADDTSRAYQKLAFFETDLDRKCKMHKRRLDLLDGCLKELNPQYYMQICRRLMFEMAEICNEIMDLKIDIIEERALGQPNVHQISKINMLAEQGIRYFGMFLDSFLDAQGQAPKIYDKNAVRPVCLAHFYIGRLYNKLLTADVNVKLANCQRTLDNYQWIVNYVESIDPTAVDSIRSEYEVCKDMVNLYPMKMDRIRAGYPMT